MVALHAVIDDPLTKLGFIAVVIGILSLNAIISRPYRSWHTNILNIALNGLMGLIVFELHLKVGGSKSTLFVDEYFYYM